MADILHRVGVEHATPDQVYAALTTLDGLAGLVDRDDGRLEAAPGLVLADRRESGSGSQDLRMLT